MGPNLYITPPSSFTHFHQDGHVSSLGISTLFSGQSLDVNSLDCYIGLLTLEGYG